MGQFYFPPRRIHGLPYICFFPIWNCFIILILWNRYEKSRKVLAFGLTLKNIQMGISGRSNFHKKRVNCHLYSVNSEREKYLTFQEVPQNNKLCGYPFLLLLYSKISTKYWISKKFWNLRTLIYINLVLLWLCWQISSQSQNCTEWHSHIYHFLQVWFPVLLIHAEDLKKVQKHLQIKTWYERFWLKASRLVWQLVNTKCIKGYCLFS